MWLANVSMSPCCCCYITAVLPFLSFHAVFSGYVFQLFFEIPFHTKKSALQVWGKPYTLSSLLVMVNSLEKTVECCKVVTNIVTRASNIVFEFVINYDNAFKSAFRGFLNLVRPPNDIENSCKKSETFRHVNTDFWLHITYSRLPNVGPMFL